MRVVYKGRALVTKCRALCIPAGPTGPNVLNHIEIINVHLLKRSCSTYSACVLIVYNYSDKQESLHPLNLQHSL